MIDLIINVTAPTNVEFELGMFISNKIVSLRNRLAGTSITKTQEVVCLCAEILELYKIAEKNEFILQEKE